MKPQGGYMISVKYGQAEGETQGRRKEDSNHPHNLCSFFVNRNQKKRLQDAQ